VNGFYLSASKDLETRIINVAKHDLGLEISKCNDSFTFYGEIQLHKILNWIKSSGYELHSTMPLVIGGSISWEKYVFEEQKK